MYGNNDSRIGKSFLHFFSLSLFFLLNSFYVSASNFTNWIPSDVVPLNYFLIMLVIGVLMFFLAGATNSKFLAVFGLALVFVCGVILINDNLGITEVLNVSEVGADTIVSTSYVAYTEGHALGYALMVCSFLLFAFMFFGGGDDD